jgi:hypothetical protein
MTTKTCTQSSPRRPLMDTLLYLLTGSAMTMVSLSFLAWLGA